jgi:hypothetical protein
MSGEITGALIPDLISGPDNVEIVRDQIAALLSLEFQNQYELAVRAGDRYSYDYNPGIYIENHRPYDNPDNELISLVNVILQKTSFPPGNPRLGNQKGKAVFWIDCAAVGNDFQAAYDDTRAALRAWKLARVVRRIIMSDQYAYLGLRGTTGSRIITSLEAGSPNNQGDSALAFIVIRITLEVEYLERSIESPVVTLERIDYDVIPETGQVKAKPSLKDRITGIANSNSEEESDVTSVGD